MKIRLVYNKYWFTFFCVKLFYTFFAIFIYAKMTKLGDMSDFINKPGQNFFDTFINSTVFMRFWGTFFNSILGDVLVCLPFSFLAFYGIYYSVSRINLSNKSLVVLLLLLSTPSFGVWTSIVSKEAIGAFFMGIILGYFIDLLDNKKRKIKIIEYIAFYLLLLFKPHYFVAILSIFIFIKTSYFFNLKANGKAILFTIHIVFAIVLIFIFKDTINEIALQMYNHFKSDSASTRANIFLEEDDFFYHAPLGMVISFFGPTISEVLDKPMRIVVFIESSIIMLFFLYFIVKVLAYTVVKKRFNIYFFSILFMAIFWLLFVHYPFGIFNAGSALRYRENYYGFLIVLLFYLYQQYKIRVSK